MAHNRLFQHLNSLPVEENINFDSECTRVYPLLQMGVFGINQEHDFLIHLFSLKVNFSKLCFLMTSDL